MSTKFKRQCLPLLCCAILIGCNADEEIAVSASAPLRSVKVLEAKIVDSTVQRVLASTVISSDTQNLSFRIGGSVTSVLVDVGDHLSAGAVIATLDQQPLKLSLKEARASLAQAVGNYRNARNQYQRARELYASGAASLSDLENAKTNSTSAQANRSLAQEGLNSAQLNLGYSELVSPSDKCQVVNVSAAINQNVNPGQPVVIVGCGDQLRLRTTVPSSFINDISLGMSVLVSLQSGKENLSGKVVEIAASTNNSSGYLVEIELTSISSVAKIGMAAQTTFDLSDDEEQQLLLPLSAVMGDSEAQFVFIATPNAEHYRIERHVVVTGELKNNGIEILQGIEEGQRVVIAGMSRISEGMNVALYTGGQP